MRGSGSGASFLLVWSGVVVFLGTVWGGGFLLVSWALEQPREELLRLGLIGLRGGLLLLASYLVFLALSRMESLDEPRLAPPPVGRRPVDAEPRRTVAASRFPLRDDVAFPTPPPAGGRARRQVVDLQELDRDLEALRARRRRAAEDGERARRDGEDALWRRRHGRGWPGDVA